MHAGVGKNRMAVDAAAARFMLPGSTGSLFSSGPAAGQSLYYTERKLH